MNMPLKTVICGTGFGTFYAEAVFRDKKNFKLAGIGARGSERSKKCAEHYGVPLYESVSQVPSDIDIACVAIRTGALGGNGTEISLEFLKKGISVILEQPVHHKEIAECFKIARHNNCCFMTGDLYLNMPEIRRMLSVTDYLRNKGVKMEYIRAGSSVQAFYPFVDILNRLVRGGNVNLEYVSPQRGSFKEAIGDISGIPFSFEFNNDMNPNDPDNHMHILHTFTLYYESGRLELSDTRGPLIWYPRLNMPWSILSEGGVPDEYPEHMKERFIGLLTPENNLLEPYSAFAGNIAIDSIGRDLLHMLEMINDNKKFLINAQKEQNSAKLWNDMTTKLGYAVMNEKLEPAAIKPDGIYEAGILPEERI